MQMRIVSIAQTAKYANLFIVSFSFWIVLSNLFRATLQRNWEYP
jgi:hypothetical protein